MNVLAAPGSGSLEHYARMARFYATLRFRRHVAQLSGRADMRSLRLSETTTLGQRATRPWRSPCISPHSVLFSSCGKTAPDPDGAEARGRRTSPRHRDTATAIDRPPRRRQHSLLQHDIMVLRTAQAVIRRGPRVANSVSADDHIALTLLDCLSCGVSTGADRSAPLSTIKPASVQSPARAAAMLPCGGAVQRPIRGVPSTVRRLPPGLITPERPAFVVAEGPLSCPTGGRES